MQEVRVFDDRIDAGDQLAARLRTFAGPGTVVVGLPRGGVPVAAVVANALGAPLDVILVRKLGVPFQPELGMGAIGEDGVRVINDEILRSAGVDDRALAAVEARERAELRRRAERYRRGRPRVPLARRTVVVVDDGVATGSTARAACLVARAEGAAHVVLAVPVAPPGWTRHLAGAADDYVALTTPTNFYGVGQFYRDFSQTSDDEVESCLRDAAERWATSRPSSVVSDDPVRLEVHGVVLEGQVTVPDDPIGLVVFAHGSGSGRRSPRNVHVATVLHDASIATALFDLDTSSDRLDGRPAFDVELIASRLGAISDAIRSDPVLGRLPVGYFGASTGAAAALHAAGDPGRDVAAVVSRGGRPDLLSPRRLAMVRAPTLLIVGARDEVVVEANENARAHLRCPTEVAVIPHASHLFDEPGTLDAAALAAQEWFVRHF